MGVYIYQSGTETEMQNAYIGEYRVPGENTIAYYPLTSSSTVNDLSGNNRTLTNNGVTFGTYAGVDCALFSSSNTKKLYGSVPLTGNQVFTVNLWVNRLGNSPASNTSGQLFVLGSVGSVGGCFGTTILNSNYRNPNKYMNWTWGDDKPSTYTNTTGTWEMLTIINSTTDVKMYRNNVLINDNAISFSVNDTNLTIGSFNNNSYSDNDYQAFYGYMSNVIIENKAWTAQERSNYYDNTKNLYGIS